MHNSETYFISKRLLQFIIVITFLFLSTSITVAQLTDTTKAQFTDTIKSTPKKYHSPKKAALMSTFLPGLGQVYNKKYWKLPIIYVGFGALAYSINYNQMKYKTYLNDLKDSYDGTYTGAYQQDQLNTLQHYYHRYRDLSVIGAAALYLLNIIDANVDAHLYTFDVSEDLSFRIHPAVINTAYVNHYSYGLSLTIKL